MTLQQTLENLRNQYQVLAEIDLNFWTDNYEQSTATLAQQLKHVHRDSYDNNQRIVFTHCHDYYVNNSHVGLILKNIQVQLNEIDISNYFAVIVSTAVDIDRQMQAIQDISEDSIPLSHVHVDGDFVKHKLDQHPYSRKEEYQYGSVNPLKINLHDLSDREKFLLTESKTFCMYPWVHIHAFPNGDVHPCCYSEMQHKLGDARSKSLKEIWNDTPMKTMRYRMLNEEKSGACKKCYEQEQHGFFSGRQSANKHFGHNINRVAETLPDGYQERFEMTYWDIRFSNLCNLKCRSCGHIFSSQWYQDQAKLAGPAWKERNTVLNYAGRTETDMWEQLIPHLEYVEQIYFAGGEPLLMEEHYNILEELLKRGRTDVRLIYNTNFTHTDLKGRSVFEYWNQFRSVAVGASLDGSGVHGEYIRKGTDWAIVEQNRKDMLAICPQVDFYVSPTLSIMNAWHLPDFHRDWVERGLIRAQDLNVNILQDPDHYRIDIAPVEYKAAIQEKYQQHLEWLKPQDPLNRATTGFESAITFMNATDNSTLIPKFWEKTEQLDTIRKESWQDAIPELKALL